ncbi:MAG: hypothetical protein R3B13_21360 [Polyangiaceae bacterium]
MILRRAVGVLFAPGLAVLACGGASSPVGGADASAGDAGDGTGGTSAAGDGGVSLGQPGCAAGVCSKCASCVDACQCNGSSLSTCSAVCGTGSGGASNDGGS